MNSNVPFTGRPEPVLIATFCAAVATLVASFVPSITPAQLAAVNVVFASAGAMLARERVTPTG